jgi:hypothetical protein
MYPHDQVLVGTVTRKKDLRLAMSASWYRVPQARMGRGIAADYIAFFLNSRVAPGEKSGIYYFARRDGLELAYRRDLLPEEDRHKRADEVYYKVLLKDFQEKLPPVLNSQNRRFAFIYTTWDRFIHAHEINDLYSEADYFVDRIYHALRNRGISPVEQYWDAERPQTGQGAHLHILCESGTVVASTQAGTGSVFLSNDDSEDAILAKIRAEIARHGGPLMVNIPVD